MIAFSQAAALILTEVLALYLFSKALEIMNESTARRWTTFDTLTEDGLSGAYMK